MPLKRNTTGQESSEQESQLNKKLRQNPHDEEISTGIGAIFNANSIALLERSINLENEDEDISILDPYLPTLQQLIKENQIPANLITMVLYHPKEALDETIGHIRDALENAQDYIAPIENLRNTEILLNSNKTAPTCTSKLNSLRDNIDVINYFIRLGFSGEDMGLILFLQRSNLESTFRVLKENQYLFNNLLKFFPVSTLLKHLLEQHLAEQCYCFENFTYRVEILKNMFNLPVAKVRRYFPIADVTLYLSYLSGMPASELSPQIYAQEVFSIVRKIFSLRSEANLTEPAKNILHRINVGQPIDDLFPENVLKSLKKLTNERFNTEKMLRMLCFTADFDSAKRVMVNNTESLIALAKKGISPKIICTIIESFGGHTASVLQKLEKQKPALDELYQFGFEDKSISCMISSSDRCVDTIITDLTASIPVFKKLLNLHFKHENISNIFHGANIYVLKIKEEIETNLGIIEQYIALGFEPTNLSNILSSKASFFDEVLTSLTTHYDCIKQSLEKKLIDHKAISGLIGGSIGREKFLVALKKMTSTLQMRMQQPTGLPCLTSSNARGIVGINNGPTRQRTSKGKNAPVYHM